MKPSLSAVEVALSVSERDCLSAIVQSRSGEIRLKERAQIVLLAAAGYSNRAIAAQTGRAHNTVRLWRDRFVLRRHAASPAYRIADLLQDQTRTGAPDRITPEEYVELLALATTTPAEIGLPFTHWTVEELAHHLVLSGRVRRISPSHVQRLLKAYDLQPHRVQEWMNRPSDPEFDARREQVTSTLADAIAPTADNEHAVVSFDEKTGIQAKQRICPDQPLRPGQPQRQEFEYVRNGTLSLLALMLVSTGQVMGVCSPQRTNEDTACILQLLIGLLFLNGIKRVTVILDQLNTHMSLPMVQAIAALCELPAPDEQTLDTMLKRRAWLENPAHAVRFLFTPKHASWLNPIERWFSVLVRRVLRRGSFHSVQELSERINAFILYFNDRLAHPYRLRRWSPADRRRHHTRTPAQASGTSGMKY